MSVNLPYPTSSLVDVLSILELASEPAKLKKIIKELQLASVEFSDVKDKYDSKFQEIEKKDDPERSYLLNRVKLARELIGTIDPVEFMSVWKTPEEILPLLKKRRDREYWETEDYEDLQELEDE